MNLHKMLQTQKELDEIVFNRTGVVEKLEDILVATIVELSEFANEFGWFKTWKTSRQRSPA